MAGHASRIAGLLDWLADLMKNSFVGFGSFLLGNVI